MSFKPRIMEKSSIKYKYVALVKDYLGNERWQVRIPRLGINKCFDDQRKAAKFVDMKMIERGKEPVNILKRK